jgi:hypothetical protein
MSWCLVGSEMCIRDSHVVMRACFGLGRREVQAARHAQVQQQQTPIQIEQQVLAPTADTQHLPAHQAFNRNPQRPTQGLAHVQGQNFGAGYPVRKTATGHFNFREFRHAFIWRQGRKSAPDALVQKVAGL